VSSGAPCSGTPFSIATTSIVRPRATASRPPSGLTASAVTGRADRDGGSRGTTSVLRIEASVAGPAAPAAIQASSVARSAAGTCGSSSGGMWSASWLLIRRVRVEAAASPGTIGSPDPSPPFRSVANRSTENAASASRSLWQPAQYVRRIGAISRSYAGAARVGVVAATARARARRRFMINA
jgi:hypothetical protein